MLGKALKGRDGLEVLGFRTIKALKDLMGGGFWLAEIARLTTGL